MQADIQAMVVQYAAVHEAWAAARPGTEARRCAALNLRAALRYLLEAKQAHARATPLVAVDSPLRKLRAA